MGFTEDLLYMFLETAGFCEIERVGQFNLAMQKNGIFITDSSEMIRYGYFISLNMVAKVCPSSKSSVQYDEFQISHAASPYPGPKINSTTT